MMKMKKILPILGLFVLTIAFFAEAIFCGKTFFLGDSSSFFYPMKHFITEVVKSGHLPLWNPYIRGGMPQLANLESGFFYPLSVIFYLFPFDISYRLFVVSHYFLAGLFMYLLLRHWNLSRYSAFFSGVVFMFSGYLVSMSNGINILSSAVWAPLIILFLDKAIRKRSLPLFLLTGLFFSIQFLSGDPVNPYFTVIICFLYLVVHIVGLVRKKTLKNSPLPAGRQAFPPLLKGGLGGFKEWSRKEGVKRSFTLLFFFLLAGVTAILLSACQLLPSIEFTRLSTRCLGLTYAHASHWSLEPRRLLTFFAPFCFGNASLSPFVYALLFKLRNPFFPSIYLGIFPLCLSLISILFVRKAQVRFFFFILLFSLILAVGKYTPLHYPFWRYLPLYDFFRFPVKAVYLTSISVAILAGFGLEWIIKGLRRKGGNARQADPDSGAPSTETKISKRFIPFSRSLLIVALPLFFLFAAFYLFRGQAVSLLQSFLSPGHLLADEFVCGTMIAAFFKAAILFGLVSILLFLAAGSTRIKPGIFKTLALAVLLGDLVAANFSVLTLTENSFYNRKPESVKFLETDKELYRLYRSPLDVGRRPTDYAVSRDDFYAWSREMVYPNLGTIYGLFYADVTEAAHLFKPDLLFNTIENQPPEIRTKLLGLLNVKYIFSLDHIRHPALRLAKDLRDDVKIYENLEFLPRAFIASEFIEVDTPEQELACLLDPQIDPGRVAVLVEGVTEPQRILNSSCHIPRNFSFIPVPYDAQFSGLDCGESAGRGSAEMEPRENREIAEGAGKNFSPVKFVKYTPGEVVIDIGYQQGGILVFTDVYYPGWKVWVDGVREELLNVDYVFRGVFLEKGTHTVRFLYDPLSIKLGIGISLIAISALAVYFLVGYNKKVRV